MTLCSAAFWKNSSPVSSQKRAERRKLQSMASFSALLFYSCRRAAGKDVHQPEHKAHGCQQKDRQLGAYPGCRRNEEGAQQCAAGVAAVHQVHAPGAVGGVIADQNGTGVDNAALSDAHHKKGRCQQHHCAGQPHDGVAHRIADGQQQHTAFHAQRTGQHAHQQPCQQVAHAHQGEQCTGHAVGKAVALLQQTDHHTCADGTDAAEEKRSQSPHCAGACSVVPWCSSPCGNILSLFNHFFRIFATGFSYKKQQKNCRTKRAAVFFL